MVYDISNPTSFEHLATWKSHFMSRCNPDGPHAMPFLVLGNKVDLEAEGKRRVTQNAAEKFCRDNGNMLFYETSAKDSTNVVQGFSMLAAEAVKR